MRKFIIAILLIIILVLGAGAIYIGYKLQQESTTAPKESEASCPSGCGLCGDGSCNECCLGGNRAGACTSDSDWTSGWFACNPQSGETGSCTITSISANKDSFTFSSGCTNATIRRYTRNYDGLNYSFYPNCITDDTNGTFVGETSVPPGSTQTLGNTPGVCEQLDAFNNGGFLVGICRCTPRAPRCNESCDASRPCASGLSCIDGVCKNSSCPGATDCRCSTVGPSCGDGNIDSGEQCDPEAVPNGCSSNQVCSDSCTCEDAPDICGDGVVGSDEQCDPVAVPDGCSSGQVCSSSCTCEDIPDSCGNGTIDPNEQCDPNSAQTGCDAGYTCNNMCQCITNTLPATAIIDVSPAQSRFLVGLLGILFGILSLKVNIYYYVKQLYRGIFYHKPFIYLVSLVSTEARNNLYKKDLDKFEKSIIQED